MEKFPFEFTYGDKRYIGFGNCELLDRTTEVSDNIETNVFMYLLDLLKITLKFTHYYSHGVSEWTLWFENVGEDDSKLLSNLESKILFEGDAPKLKGILGDHENYYAPYEKDLSAESVEFVSDTGRATHINFPYFNLEYGNGGSMLAIGWGGTWKANFEFDGKNTLYTAKSVINLATYLKPNEKIRTALFVVGDYALRDDAYATNYWRSWYMEHNIPKADSEGNAIAPFSTCCIAGDTGLPNSDGSISERYFTWKPSLEKMISEDVKSDFRWVDAGWYIAPDLHSEETNWWGTVGTWTLDPVKWPEKTFLESTDFARANGMKTLMWFEPERVSDVDNLVKNFGYNEKWGIKMEGTKAISNNIGDPECFEWTVGQICKVLRDNKVEMYREDNNCKAAELWAYMDTVEGTDRLGITESKLIDAHYRMWDKLIECTLSYGGCGFVDSCASGGGRNDLESMRRGIPLLRSDADRTTISLRLSMTSSFNKWIPFCGASTKETRLQLETAGLNDTYIWRTSYLAALNLYSRFVYAEDGEFEALRKGISEWKEINKYLLKEFYTLTPWHHRDDRAGFTAFMYFDPDEEKGILFAVRQEECEEDTVELTLPIFEACTVTDKDTNLALDIKNRKIRGIFAIKCVNHGKMLRFFYRSVKKRC